MMRIFIFMNCVNFYVLIIFKKNMSNMNINKEMMTFFLTYLYLQVIIISKILIILTMLKQKPSSENIYN